MLLIPLNTYFCCKTIQCLYVVSLRTLLAPSSTGYPSSLAKFSHRSRQTRHKGLSIGNGYGSAGGGDKGRGDKGKGDKGEVGGGEEG